MGTCVGCQAGGWDWVNKDKCSQLPDQSSLHLWKAVSLAKVRRAPSLTTLTCEQRMPTVICYLGFGTVCWLCSINMGKGTGLWWDILIEF